MGVFNTLCSILNLVCQINNFPSSNLFFSLSNRAVNNSEFGLDIEDYLVGECSEVSNF